ncbi:MAG TPA: head GIN domain-containing protein [Pyrinomonadaceae bacterium]|nr:head GIN domain-containing protein [Pyrinomonadaceae bacterium]
MKKAHLVTFAILSILLASSCRYMGRGIRGSGNRKTEKRDLASFKSVEAAGGFEVNIICQQPQSFEIEGDDNLLPLIETDVNDGALRIHSDQQYNASKPITIRISVPDLAKYTSAGAGDVHIAGVKNEHLVLGNTGAANIEAAGLTKVVDIKSSGAGNIETRKLQAERATVTVAGAANVDVYASQQLDVSVSGIGSVTYSGNPPVVNKTVSGIGSVNKKE